MDQKRRTEILLVSQTIFITLLLYWMFLESQSNAYFRGWLSQYFPLRVVPLNGRVLALAITARALVTGFLVGGFEVGPPLPRPRAREKPGIGERFGVPRLE